MLASSGDRFLGLPNRSASSFSSPLNKFEKSALTLESGVLVATLPAAPSVTVSKNFFDAFPVGFVGLALLLPIGSLERFLTVFFDEKISSESSSESASANRSSIADFGFVAGVVKVQGKKKRKSVAHDTIHNHENLPIILIGGGTSILAGMMLLL